MLETNKVIQSASKHNFKASLGKFHHNLLPTNHLTACCYIRYAAQNVSLNTARTNITLSLLCRFSINKLCLSHKNLKMCTNAGVDYFLCLPIPLIHIKFPLLSTEVQTEFFHVTFCKVEHVLLLSRPALYLSKPLSLTR